MCLGIHQHTWVVYDIDHECMLTQHNSHKMTTEDGGSQPFGVHRTVYLVQKCDGPVK